MKESFAASFILRPPQIESINSDGSNRRTILTAKDRINRPTAMAIMDRFAILSFFLIFFLIFPHFFLIFHPIVLQAPLLPGPAI